MRLKKSRIDTGSFFMSSAGNDIRMYLRGQNPPRRYKLLMGKFTDGEINGG